MPKPEVPRHSAAASKQPALTHSTQSHTYMHIKYSLPLFLIFRRRLVGKQNLDPSLACLRPQGAAFPPIIILKK